MKDNQQDKATEDYPGFVVHDDRVTGSITLGPTRMPLWAPISTMIQAGYDAAIECWPSLPAEGSPEAIGSFLEDLFQQRKEFGRLLCVLADVERQERVTRDTDIKPWYGHPEHVKRVRTALQNCLQHLNDVASQEYECLVGDAALGIYPSSRLGIDWSGCPGVEGLGKRYGLVTADNVVDPDDILAAHREAHSDEAIARMLEIPLECVESCSRASLIDTVHSTWIG